MLLSPRYKFLFVHIPKTGGTSVRVALRGVKWKDPWRIPLCLCSRMSALFGHRLACKLPRHAKVIAAKEMLPRDFFENLFKFAFVRNPWDLQVSSFHHIRRERPHLMQGLETFDAFLKYKLHPKRPYVFHFDVSIERQSDYLVDLDGSLLVDFVGRYERLEEDFAEACRRIGIRPPALPHKRKATDRRDYRTYYTDETAELVARHFRRDIELFGYRFDDV
ncbi:MAG: sulfotransferase family 2 domain-containing protein [Thermodesulfobacteriota bacterium]|nr:sulfotransferase family 2 domain-containing protein [Thermodesulfobacteriota bacterium]